MASTTTVATSTSKRTVMRLHQGKRVSTPARVAGPPEESESAALCKSMPRY
jgi:hypothetical protein